MAVQYVFAELSRQLEGELRRVRIAIQEDDRVARRRRRGRRICSCQGNYGHRRVRVRRCLDINRQVFAVCALNVGGASKNIRAEASDD